MKDDPEPGPLWPTITMSPVQVEGVAACPFRASTMMLRGDSAPLIDAFLLD